MNAYCSRSSRIVLDPRNHSSFDEQSNKSAIGSHRAQRDCHETGWFVGYVSIYPFPKRRWDVFEVFLEIGGKCVSLPVARLSKKQRCCATRSILRSCLVCSRLYTGCLRIVRATRGWVFFIFENIITRTFVSIHWAIFFHLFMMTSHEIWTILLWQNQSHGKCKIEIVNHSFCINEWVS